MTTTTLTSYASTYAVGRQHVHFDVRSSTPTSGAMNDRDAQGQWRVERGGTIIKRENGVLDFGWLGLDGDVIHARAVDSAGNAGDWETYTYSVTANTAADEVHYVNGTTGSDVTGDGSSGNPWASIGQAVSEIEAVLTSGQVGVVFVAGGITYSESTFSGGTTAYCIRVVWDGTGGTRPHVDFAEFATGFQTGMRKSWHLEGLHLDGNDTAQNQSQALDFARVGGVAADRSAYNCMMINCETERWGLTVTGQDSVLVPSERDLGVTDFIAFEDVTTDESVSRYAFYGFNFADKWLFRNVTIGGTSAVNFSALRLWQLGRGYAEDVTVDTNNTGSRSRILPGPSSDSTGAMRLNSWVRLDHVDGGGIGFEPDSGVAGLAYMEDVRFVSCRVADGFITFRASEGGADNMVVPTRVDFVNHSMGGGFDFDGNVASGGVMQSVRFRDCGVSHGYQNGAFLNLDGQAASSFADGCFDAEGCFVYWGMAHNFEGGGAFVTSSGGMTLAEIAAKMGDCDYNHTGKVDGDFLRWARHSDSPFSSDLAAWQTESSLDANSSTNNNTTFSLTDDGYTTPTDLDLTLTNDTGPLSGAGLPLTSGVALDALGYLRDASTPDAGPYEYGASATPGDPTLGSPNNPPVADAGPDQGVTEATLVTLDGTGSSDPDSDPLTYAWTQTSGTAVVLSDDAAAQPTFTAPAAPATLMFELEVDDGTDTDTDTVTVTVSVAPPPPEPRTPPGGAARSGPHAPDARRTKSIIRKFGLNRKPPVKPSKPPQSVRRAIKKPPSRPSKLPRSLRDRFGR